MDTDVSELVILAVLTTLLFILSHMLGYHHCALDVMELMSEKRKLKRKYEQLH